jgi:hypothetical protein
MQGNKTAVTFSATKKDTYQTRDSDRRLALEERWIRTEVVLHRGPCLQHVGTRRQQALCQLKSLP